MRKKLIEVALPLDEINKAAAKEKSIRHGHPSTLHLWWARRPLAACRAMLLGLLLPDPCDQHCPDDFILSLQRLGMISGRQCNSGGLARLSHAPLRSYTAKSAKSIPKTTCRFARAAAPTTPAISTSGERKNNATG